MNTARPLLPCVALVLLACANGSLPAGTDAAAGTGADAAVAADVADQPADAPPGKMPPSADGPSSTLPPSADGPPGKMPPPDGPTGLMEPLDAREKRGDGGRPIGNWLAPCSLDPSLGQGAGFAGAPECSDQLCLRFADAVTGCLRVGCSVHCNRDEDCPEGATCQAFPSLSPTLKSGKACRPGRSDPARACADGGN